MSDDGSDRPQRPPDTLLPRPRRTVRSVFPVVRWLPSYDWRRSGPDLIAGVALAAILIPESMGYANVAGVPAEVGLYAALGAVVAYALTAGTSVLVVGPASAVAALSASIVADIGGGAGSAELVAALAITSGLLLIVAGAFRLGWIVNFISRPVLRAFVAGLSIAIIIGQLDGLFGVDGEGDSPVVRLAETVRHVADWHGLTVVIGVAALIALLLMERFVRKVPAAVIVVVGGIILGRVFDLGDRGVATVGEIPQGLPSVGIPDLSGTQWIELAAGALALLLVGYSEGYAAASAASAASSEEVDPDQELIGSGAANIGAGVLGGMPVGGSLSKTAASQGAGARTQMANLVAGAIVLATLLILAPLFEDLPEPVLAAVVISAILGSADPRRLIALRRINRPDFVAAAVTFALVLVWETLPALIVGVLLSLAFVVRRASFPEVVELARNDDGSFRHAVSQRDVPADTRVAVIRFEAPLVYTNAERLLRAARTLADKYPHLVRVVIDGEMASDLDSSGAHVLRLLDDELADRGIELHLARFHFRARAQIDRSNLRERFDGRLHMRLKDAVPD